MPGLLAVKRSPSLALDKATGGGSRLRNRMRRNSEVTFLVHFAAPRLLSCGITLYSVYIPRTD